MSQYITRTYGPGDIAALPPTIGLTSRAPTIGAEDVSVPIPQAFPFTPARRGGTRVGQATALGWNGVPSISGRGAPYSPYRPYRPYRPAARPFMRNVIRGASRAALPFVPAPYHESFARQAMQGLGVFGGENSGAKLALAAGAALLTAGLYYHFKVGQEGISLFH